MGNKEFFSELLKLCRDVYFFKDLLFIFIYFIYFWLHRVLAAAGGIFVEAHGLLSSCGARASL